MTTFDDIINKSSSAAIEFPELNQIVREPDISHQYLANVVQNENGHHSRYLFDTKIIRAKDLILYTDRPVAGVTFALIYILSDVSKFFLKWTSDTPGTFRKNYQQNILNYKKPKSSP